MTEAVQAVLNYGFNELQLSLITANCYPHNKRSQQVLERNGFICEGVLHQAELTYNGNIYDHLCYYLPNICRPAPEGYGRRLLEYATRRKQMNKVDVNEQNDKALGFYLRMGFRIIGRDETDGMGKPYPILHLQLPEAENGNK